MRPATRTRDSADPQRADARQRARGQPTRTVLAPQTAVVHAAPVSGLGDVVAKPGRYAVGREPTPAPCPPSDNRSVIDGELEGSPRPSPKPVALEVTE
jgi:hypothetical protein